MALNRQNTNPALAVFSYQPNAGYTRIVPPSGDGTSGPGTVPGRGWEWFAQNGDDVANSVSSVLCMLNPRRSGCPGDPNMQPTTIVQEQKIPVWLIAILVIIVILLIVLIVKK